MARTRNLKMGLFQNEVLAELPFEGRLLFAGLPLLADRAGRLEDRPRRIKAALFPFDDVAIDALLVRLTERGFLTRYQAGGVAIIQITNFGKHQHPHPKEPPSQLPENTGEMEKPWKATELPREDTAGAIPNRAGSSFPSLSSLPSLEVISSAPKLGAEPSSVLIFPCVGTPNVWPLTEAHLSEWGESYPTVEILAEARKALAWIRADLSHRKTARGMPRFLVRWFGRCVDDRRAGPERRAVPRLEPDRRLDDNWAEECQRLHDRRCNGRSGHILQMQLDAARRERESA